MNCRRSKAITLTLMVLTLWAAGEIGPSAESAANTAWLPAQAIPAAWAAAAAAVFALAAIAWALARLAAGSNWRPRT